MSRPAAVLGLSGTAYDMGEGLMGQELSLLDWESTAWPHRASSAEPSAAGDGLQPRLSASVRCRTEKESKIVQNSAGETVADILKRKKARVKQAPLPSGSPDWDTLMQMTWEHIEEGARANRPGFKVVRKLLTDKRFDK